MRHVYQLGLTLPLALLPALAVVSGCGGAAQSPPDAAIPSTSLVISSSESIGLAFGQRAHLVVQVEDEGGVPVAGEIVGWTLVATVASESTAGSTLSLASVVSDATGHAAVDLTAGAARASFRVVASVTTAPPVTFYVIVTDEGFADLVVRPAHVGPRAGAGLGTVEVRLYNAGTGCAHLSAESPPDGSYPPRSVGDGGSVTFASLAASDGYSVLAWSRSPAGLISADGCVDLAPGQLRPGAVPLFDLPVSDRPLGMASSYLLTSTIDLFAVRQRLVGPGTAWARLACPRGAAQLLLDCAIDLLDSGDPDDCQVTTPGDLAQKLQTARDAADASGCRGGTGSLDAAVMALLDASPTARTAAIAEAAVSLDDFLDSTSMTATLFPAGSAATLELATVGLEAHGARFQTNLLASARPLVAVPVTFAADDDVVTLGPAQLTIRVGRLLRASLSVDTGLLGGTDIATGLVGATTCKAVSRAACTAAGAPTDCLTQACLDAAPLLARVVDEPFAALTTSDVDLELDGSALADDGDGDLVADHLTSGVWRATVHLASGETVRASGAFDGP